MRSQGMNGERGTRRRRGRNVIRLNGAALWERLALLNRSQNRPVERYVSCHGIGERITCGIVGISVLTMECQTLARVCGKSKDR